MEQNKYRMIKKAGAYQEGFGEQSQELEVMQMQMQAPSPIGAGSFSQMANCLVAGESASNFFSGGSVIDIERAEPERNVELMDLRRSKNDRAPELNQPNQMERYIMSGLFYYTVPEGQKVLVIAKDGKGEIKPGPCRIWRKGKKIRILQHYIAYPGEFLIVRMKDGEQQHLPGPSECWLDPRIHSSIEKEDALQIAAKQSVVLYTRPEKKIERKIVEGPAVFTPQPGEWLHTFSWHGSSGAGYKKVPGAMVFQKLWLMPDQMYHDVEEVRTADDVILTIRLMVFFELVNVEKMLDATHDPIGDFINATSSDTLELVGRFAFDTFKGKTDLLNNLDSYPQLKGRAEQVGYRIHKIVFRGYATSSTLQGMHEQAIETRTRLKLETEAENQAQELADFKQEKELHRSRKLHILEQEQEHQKLGREKEQHAQKMLFLKKEDEMKRLQKGFETEDSLLLERKQSELKLEFLQSIHKMEVDLTSYLTQSRADKVIELRGGQQSIAPHLHLPSEPKKS